MGSIRSTCVTDKKHKFLVGRSEKKKLLRGSICKWDGSIKVGHKEVGCEDVQ
jgi:hypothetical protein